MKTLFGLLTLSLFLSSCGKETTSYLYGKGSQNERLAQAQLAKKCMNEHKIFALLDKETAFNVIFASSTERLYKIERKLTGTEEKATTTFVRIIQNAVDTSEMIVRVVRSEPNPKDGLGQYMSFNFTSADNKELLNTVQEGVCTPEKYTLSSSWNDEYLNFSSSRLKKIDDTYFIKKTETSQLKVGIPSILSQLAQAETYESKTAEDTTKWSYTTGTITEINEIDCTTDLCKKTTSSAGLIQCDSLVIDTDHYSSEDPTQKLLTLSQCHEAVK